MSECLFCNIIDHKIDSEIVYEDNDVIAFLDINPVNPGHILVVPKKHEEVITDLDDEILLKVIKVVKLMASILLKMDYKGVNIIQNNYSAAGQVVPHIHFHVIPRTESDGLAHWPGHTYKDGEAQKVASTIRSLIN